MGRRGAKTQAVGSWPLAFGQREASFDGTVNVLDLVALLLAFGDACP